MKGAPRLPVTAASRLLRAPICWTTLTPLALVGAALMVMYSGLFALTLDARLALQRDLGSFEQQAGFGVVSVPPGAPALDRIQRSVRRQAPDSFVHLAITGMVLDSGEDVYLREGEWAQRPLPDRYRLATGRWPERPGEVVVAASAGAPADIGSRLSALGGALSLRVVGSAVDNFPFDRPTWLTASGTWENLPGDALRGYEAVAADPVVMWSGAPLEAVAHDVGIAVADVVDRPRASSRYERRFRASAITRSYVRDSPSPGWVQKVPAAFTIPALLFPSLLILLAWAVRGERHRSWSRLMVAQGVQPRTARSAVWIAFAIPAIAAVIVAVALGLIGSYAVRPLLDAVHDEPLSAPVSPVRPAVILLVGTAASTLVVGTVWTLRGLRRRPRPRRWVTPTWVTDVRQVLSAVAIAAVAFGFTSAETPLHVMWISGALSLAVILASPELVGLSRRVLTPESRGVRRRLAGRLVSDHPGRFTVSAGVVTGMLGLSLGFQVMLSTLAATVSEDIRPDVLPGQLLLVDRAIDFLPPATTTSELAEADRGLAGATKLTLTPLTDYQPRQRPETRALLPGEDNYLMALSSVEEARDLLGSRLDSAASQLLADGGVLQLGRDPDTPAAEGISVVRGSQVVRDVDLPVATVATPRVDWLQGISGITLLSTAQAHDLPSRSGPVMYTGLSMEQTRSIREGLASQGVDPGTVRVFVPPEVAVPPVGLVLTAVGLAVMTLLVLVAEARSRVAAVRPYLERLFAVGLEPTWLRDVLLLQQAVLMLAGVAGALAIAVVPLWFTVGGLGREGYVLEVPWGQLTATVIAVLAGCMASLVLAARGLHPKT